MREQFKVGFSPQISSCFFVADYTARHKGGKSVPFFNKGGIFLSYIIRIGNKTL